MLPLTLSSVFLFGNERGQFYRPGHHTSISTHHLAIAVNISPQHNFLRFQRQTLDREGNASYIPHNRFPFGGYALIKLATLPFSGSLSAQLYAARILMLLFFSAAATLAYLSLCRITASRWIALAATLLAFSAYYTLYYSDMVSNEAMIDFFGVILVFHGMVIFEQDGRFRQLLVKTCAALLLGWHVYALLLPFVTFSLARDIMRVYSDASSASMLIRTRTAVASLIRSRYIALGVAALVFGASILAFNFAREYSALDGETPLTELPSFRSMVYRTGQSESFNTTYADHLAWPRFLEAQIERVGGMTFPYSLRLASGWMLRAAKYFNRSFLSGALQEYLDAFGRLQIIGVGIMASGVCLVGLVSARHKLLLATLAVSGFFWSVPMRHSVTFHSFEAIYYIGIPLVFFSLILLYVHRRMSGHIVGKVAVAAGMLIFIFSSFQMARVGYGAEDIESNKQMFSDLEVIRDITKDKVVFVPQRSYELNYYLSGSIILYGGDPIPRKDFFVATVREDGPDLLTPENRRIFLYDAAGYEDMMGRIVEEAERGQHVIDSYFDVYLVGNRLTYIRDSCKGVDDRAKFFLDLIPVDENDLPNNSRRDGFDSLGFYFNQFGFSTEWGCVILRDFPGYEIAYIRTGQSNREGVVTWEDTYDRRPHVDEIIKRAQAGRHVARSKFDVYISEGKLTYIKAPCENADVADRFLLHLVPVDSNDLPVDSGRRGSDNFDFDFGKLGIEAEGKCVVQRTLPEYQVYSVTTGQFDGGGRIWEGSFFVE